MPSGAGHKPAAASRRPAKRASQERRLFSELTRLARFIDAAKRDIAAMHPDEIRTKHLPNATDELDAIVAATAEATGAILDSAEKLTAMCAGADPALRDQITEQATRIFEACSFQDITGQRITKVVKTLKQIEAKVDELVQAFGDVPPPARGAKPAGDDEAALLNGPQLPQNAASQSDIDALFEKE
jgi:chemotaxis protein CheZ